MTTNRSGYNISNEGLCLITLILKHLSCISQINTDGVTSHKSLKKNVYYYRTGEDLSLKSFRKMFLIVQKVEKAESL